MELQKNHPLKEIQWKEEWSCSLFRRIVGFISTLESSKYSDLQLIEKMNELTEFALSFDRDYQPTELTTDDTNVDSEENNDDMEYDDPTRTCINGTGEEYSSFIECVMDTEEEVIDVDTEYKHSYSLLTFCPTRWYSAWSVMVRFYSLFDALSALQMECSSGRLKKNDGGLFGRYMERIDKEELLKIVHYLRPLVQAINFFQSDNTTQWDVLPIFNELILFYSSKTSDPLSSIQTHGNNMFIFPPGTVENAFGPRMDLFNTKYPALRQLYTDEFVKQLPYDWKMDDERVVVFKQLLFEEIERLCNPEKSEGLDAVVNRLQIEALCYLKLYRSRKGLTIEEFLELHEDKVKNIANKFQELFSLPASSAAVERSFSVQGCFLSPRRGLMGLSTIKNLMTIRMNFLLAERNGWEQALISHITSSAKEKGI